MDIVAQSATGQSVARLGLEAITGVSKDFLTIMLADQRFGIPILQVQDVLGEQRITRVPLAPHEVVGALNLRGRIVTAIDLRRRLGMEDRAAGSRSMSVVVEYEGELYSLIIDKVGDVMTLQDQDFEKNPATLDSRWREVSVGIYRLKKELLVILDVPRLLANIV